MASAELACLDGTVGPAVETAIPVTEEGFLRGDGAFEVVRVYRGRPYALAEHLDRMAGSASALRLDGSFPRAEYQREDETRVEHDAPPVGTSRGTVARGGES